MKFCQKIYIQITKLKFCGSKIFLFLLAFWTIFGEWKKKLEIFHFFNLLQIQTVSVDNLHRQIAHDEQRVGQPKAQSLKESMLKYRALFPWKIIFFSKKKINLLFLELILQKFEFFFFFKRLKSILII